MLGFLTNGFHFNKTNLMSPAARRLCPAAGSPGRENVFWGNRKLLEQSSAWGADAKVASADKPTGCCRGLDSHFSRENVQCFLAGGMSPLKRCSGPSWHSSRTAGAPMVRGSDAARLGV